jgi:perosamine synthetase
VNIKNRYENFNQLVVEAIRSVVGFEAVALHEPRFSGNEWKYLKDCLDSTFVSSVGKYVDQFENELAAYVGVKHAVAMVNGTAALHIALILAGVKQDEEVLIPSLTFVATANAVSYCGGIPHFIDSEEKTLGVDAYKLSDYLKTITKFQGEQCVNRFTGKVIRALVPMHTFGHPCELEELLSVAKDFKLILVEDAAESLGSTYHGRHTGTFGLMGTLSFNGNKTITTGGGGAIITNDSDIAHRAKHLTTTAKKSHRWAFEHDEVGFNYRMPNLNAALGLAQLEQLPSFIESKRRLFRKYQSAFKNIEGVRLFEEPPECKGNYWLQTLLLNEANIDQLDALLEATNEVGLMTRPAWKLMNDLPHFQNCPTMNLDVAQSLSKRIVNIPSSASLAIN